LKRLIFIGLPIGLEFFFMSLVMGVMYWVIRKFGADAQAGLAEGQAAMRFIMLPAMAVAFAAAPIAGQNFGARKPERVREAFNWTVALSIGIMLALTVFCQFGSHLLMHIFTYDEAVVSVGATMLAITSWNFAANGIIFSCSSMFQGLGNTWPTISSSIIRLFVFIAPAIWLSQQPHFDLVHVWYLSVCSMFLQAVVSFTLLRREFRLKLTNLAPVPQPGKWGQAPFSRKRGLTPIQALSRSACDNTPNNSSMCLGSMMSAGESAMVSPVVRMSKPRSKHFRNTLNARAPGVPAIG
jgi:Na+-driven multidrug efflux pump